MLGLWMVVAALLCWAGPLHSARILAIFPHTGKSHFFMFRPFVERLAHSGNDVTVVTHFPDTNHPPTLNYVSLGGSKVLYNSAPMDVVEGVGSWGLQASASVLGLAAMGQETCADGLAHPNLQAFYRSNRTFDLVIVEFFNSDCFAAFAHHYRAPLIGIFSSVMMPWHNDRFGNPDNPSYIVNHFLPHPSEMSLLQRVVNTFATFSSKVAYRVLMDWPADSLVKTHLGPGFPPVREIVRNASLFLINSHFSLFQPRPLVPGIVELGGIHVTPPSKDLPPHLRQFLDSAPEGIVLFSLGSTVNGSTMSESRRRTITQALGRLPLKVLMKWEVEVLPEIPPNVLIQKWLPQNELLAHPKVKLFMTHSGLMGTEEAIYHGVPMVMMPLLGDQPVNAASCEEKGVGVVLNFFTMTSDTLYSAAMTVLQDPRFAERSRRLSAIFKDRPMSSMDAAVYWTEYVVRYQGAPHLRSAAVRLPWYSECLLDVFAVFGLLLYLGARGVAFLFRRCCRRRAGPAPQKQKTR